MAPTTQPPECRFCCECGQRLESNSTEQPIKEMVDFDAEPAYSRVDLRDFNDFFKNNVSASNHEYLLQIFTSEPTTDASREKIDAHVMQDPLESSLPSELPEPLAPLRIRRPALDFLTGLELGSSLPKAEVLKPCKYIPRPTVGILIEIEDVNEIKDERKPLSFEEAAEIMRFLFPELEALPIEDKLIENFEPLQDEIASSIEKSEQVQDEIPVPEAPAPEIKPKKKKKKAKSKKKKDSITEIPIRVETPKPIVTSVPQLRASMMPKRVNLSCQSGESGTKIQVLVNMLAINLGDNLPREIEHYHVSYEPSKPRSLILKAYEAAKAQLFPDVDPAYRDGQLFSAGCLPIESPLQLTVKVKEYDEEETDVKVTIVKMSRQGNEALDLSWMRDVLACLPNKKKSISSVTALQIIMNSVAMKHSIPAKGSYFIPTEYGPADLGGSLEMWCGLFQSVILGWKPFLKVDVVHKAFIRNISVIDYVKSFIVQRTNVLTYHDIKANLELIKERLTNLLVRVECNDKPRRRQLVAGVVEKRTYDTVWPHKIDGQMMRLTDYFAMVKNYEIRYPDLPCLFVVDHRGNYFHFPMELCTIEGEQSFKWSKPNRNHMEVNLQEAAVTDANDRRRKIFHVFNTVNKEDDACLASFGVSLNREFEEVEARILDPPTLHFHENHQVKPENGAWNVKCFQSPTVRLKSDFSWTILNLSGTGMDVIHDFSVMFQREALKLGLTIGAPRMPFASIEGKSTSKYTIGLHLKELKEFNVQLVVVVIPDRYKKLYCTIKQMAELDIGILTQCVRKTTIENHANEETVRNILMKVNAKLNGVNYSFVSEISRPKCLSEACIIVGADVTHPRSNVNEPSIAAVVASHDPNTHFQYNVELRFQPPWVEIMDDLESMMREQLLNFYGRSGCKPVKIIFYRDGVGEGDFVRVMNKELLAIRRACVSLEEAYKPAITFMIVQKRINTRFFPVRDEESACNRNVKVGTVVDTVVTHPTDIDFILVSHPNALGTTRPTKYRCLWDDSNMGIDELERLTYYLCHMFARCSKSVKYPAPTYYAHLAAARARNLMHRTYVNLEDLPNEQVKLKVHKDLVTQSPMYFL